jgi:hypothetical protein
MSISWEIPRLRFFLYTCRTEEIRIIFLDLGPIQKFQYLAVDMFVEMLRSTDIF